MSHEGRVRCGSRRRAYVLNVSTSWRCASVQIVSNTSDDLPLPLTPVKATSLCLGTSTSMPLRFCVRARLGSRWRSSSIFFPHPRARQERTDHRYFGVESRGSRPAISARTSARPALNGSEVTWVPCSGTTRPTDPASR